MLYPSLPLLLAIPIVTTKAFLSALEAPHGPIYWLQRLPSEKSSGQIDSLSKALQKIAANTPSSPRIQLSLRTLRHKLALSHPSTSIDTIAKSTFHALRMFYATTKSDGTSYNVCAETLAPILDALLPSPECTPLINFMGILARKAGSFAECMKWNDLGLRRAPKENRAAMAVFTLRNAAVLFSLKEEELKEREGELETRMGYAMNCLGKLEGMEGAEGVPEELDFLRRTVLSTSKGTLEGNNALREARMALPKRILKACIVLVASEPVSIPPPPSSPPLVCLFG